MINFKTYSKSFKDKTRIDNPEENWVIFKDVHEPIVDRDTFEQVQKKVIKRTKRRAPKSENGEKSIFSDLLYCADCGHKLWYHVNTINKNICFFSCSNYVKDYRGSCPTRHYVRADAIAAIRKFMQMDELTAPLLRELIDHIEVYETQGVGKSRTQRITIHYRFVGYIDIPAAPLTSHYISETRQGVAVEYIPA